jgi:hypothetical protein
MNATEESMQTRLQEAACFREEVSCETGKEADIAAGRNEGIVPVGLLSLATSTAPAGKTRPHQTSPVVFLLHELPFDKGRAHE